MQLYGYPPFLEEPYEMPMAAVPDPFMGPEFFPFAPELGNAGMFMDNDFAAFVASVEAEFSSEDESEYEDESESDWEEEEPEHHIKAKSMKTKKKQVASKDADEP